MMGRWPYSPLARATQITIGYAVVAAAWIAGGDDLAGLRSHDSVREWMFVGATSAALYTLLYWRFRMDSRLLRDDDARRAEIHQLSQFRESIIDNANMWINVLDPMANVTVWNKAAEQISGYTREEVVGHAGIWELLYPDPEYRTRIVMKAEEILNEGAEVKGFETRIRSKDGTEKIISWNSRRFFDETGEVIGSIAIGKDITDRKRAEDALVARERQLAVLMDNLPGMAYRCRNDEHWTVEFASSGCHALTGYSADALIGNRDITYVELIHPDDREEIRHQVQCAIAEQEPFALEYRLQQRGGNEIWVWEQGQAVECAINGPLLEGIIIDITERKRMEQKLELLATQDSLTGLYNRRELEAQLGEEVDRAGRYGRPLSVLWMDVDRFKEINDRFGHLVGDEVLRRLGRLLQASIRNMDYAARYGGEEFVIVLPEMTMSEAVEVGERLRRLVASSPVLAGDERHEVTVTLSIGVASFPDHARTRDQLSKEADDAMYLSKQAGRNRICTPADESAQMDEQ